MNYATVEPATIFNRLFTPDMLDEVLSNGKTVRQHSGYLIDRIATIQKREPLNLFFIAQVREKYATLENRQGIQSSARDVRMHQWLEGKIPSKWKTDKPGCVCKLEFLLAADTVLKNERRDFWKLHVMRGAQIVGLTTAGMGVAGISGLAAVQHAAPPAACAKWVASATGAIAEGLKVASAHFGVAVAAGASALAGKAHRVPVQATMELSRRVEDLKESRSLWSRAVPDVVFDAVTLVRAGTVADRVSALRKQSLLVAQLSHAWGVGRPDGERIQKTSERVGDLMERLVSDMRSQSGSDAGARAWEKSTFDAIGRWVENTGDAGLKKRFRSLMEPEPTAAPSRPKLSL